MPARRHSRSIESFAVRAILLIAQWLRAADLIEALCPTRRGLLVTSLLRLLSRKDREIFLLRKRLSRIPAANRSRFRPSERIEILEHGERHGMSTRRLARFFLVDPETIARWKRAVDRGRTALVTTLGPLTRFRDLVREVARMLRRAHPHWGSKRIAHVLAKLGLEAARTTVQRHLRRPPAEPKPPVVAVRARRVPRGVNPKRPHHVWLMDFSTVSMILGFFPVRVGAVLDSFSRKIVAIALCRGEPDAKWTCRLLGAAIRNAGVAPDHMITDCGTQFTSRRFKKACKRHGIRWRHGAVGSPKSIGRLERFWRSLKAEWATALLCFATERLLNQRLQMWIDWYNAARVHAGVEGRTPNDVEKRRPRRRRRTVKPGDKFVLERRDMHDQPCMPVYRLRKLAS